MKLFDTWIYTAIERARCGKLVDETCMELCLLRARVRRIESEFQIITKASSLVFRFYYLSSVTPVLCPTRTFP